MLDPSALIAAPAFAFRLLREDSPASFSSSCFPLCFREGIFAVFWS